MVGHYLPFGLRIGQMGVEWVLLHGWMTPFSSIELMISCAGSYDSREILFCLTKVAGALGCIGIRTTWRLVRPQSKESLANDYLNCYRTWRSLRRSASSCMASESFRICWNCVSKPGFGSFVINSSVRGAATLSVSPSIHCQTVYTARCWYFVSSVQHTCSLTTSTA